MRSWSLLGRAGLVIGLLAACRPLDLPTTSAPPSATPPSVCTPPPCQPGATYACPSGDCPGGCGAVCENPPSVTSSFQPPTPAPMCTPPACWSDEAYFCPEACPNGCGTTCATRTPDPAAAPTPTFPAPAGICDLPAAPSSGEPAVVWCLSVATATVGSPIYWLVEAAGLEQPRFSVQGRDAGDGYGGLSFQAEAENRVRALSASSQVVRIVSLQVTGQRLFLALEALAPGALELQVAAGPEFGPFLPAAPARLVVVEPP